MSEPWEAEVFRVPDLSVETQAPPALYPVPAQYVPDLEVGAELTIGRPEHFFVDGQVLATAERKRTIVAGFVGEHEALAVAAPYAYWVSKGFRDVRLTMQWWPVTHAWLYRDAVNPGEEQHAGPPRPHDHAESWLDHVRPTLHEPPVREPQPARLAGSLTGRTVRIQLERGVWSWLVAVSEPVDQDGDFVVRVMSPSAYWLAQALYHPSYVVQAVPLHRLYVYA